VRCLANDCRRIRGAGVVRPEGNPEFLVALPHARLADLRRVVGLAVAKKGRRCAGLCGRDSESREEVYREADEFGVWGQPAHTGALRVLRCRSGDPRGDGSEQESRAGVE
jgi:hypothetical protein